MSTQAWAAERARPRLPHPPALLGQFTPAEAEDIGAFRDDALAAPKPRRLA